VGLRVLVLVLKPQRPTVLPESLRVRALGPLVLVLPGQPLPSSLRPLAEAPLPVQRPVLA
jgi:hypothetical protein